MPPIPIPAKHDDAAKYEYGIEPEVVLKLKEKALEARGRAYCMFCPCLFFFYPQIVVFFINHSYSSKAVYVRLFVCFCFGRRIEGRG